MASMGILRAQPWYEIDYLWIDEEHNDISYGDIGWKVLQNWNVHIFVRIFSNFVFETRKSVLFMNVVNDWSLGKYVFYWK